MYFYIRNIFIRIMDEGLCWGLHKYYMRKYESEVVVYRTFICNFGLFILWGCEFDAHFL